MRAMVLGRDDPELGLGLALDELGRCWDSGHRTVAPVLITTTATFMSRLGRVEDAARTLGIGDRVRGDWFDLSEILSDFDRDDDVVKVLGRERYDELFAEGAGMEPDDGVAWLLRGRGAHARATFGWEALTPTERSVAEKAAEGLSNQQIADALFVSPNTVKTHLRNIYTKLRVSSRAALATEFAEHRG
ncbi:MAG: helix-turn-helix transcriptional regulator [Nitriliruptorales bacterium]|nr:helix-turn-helix transcriptional regulator [Nitriliruptorales bacterium]